MCMSICVCLCVLVQLCVTCTRTCACNIPVNGRFCMHTLWVWWNEWSHGMGGVMTWCAVTPSADWDLKQEILVDSIMFASIQSKLRNKQTLWTLFCCVVASPAISLVQLTKNIKQISYSKLWRWLQSVSGMFFIVFARLCEMYLFKYVMAALKREVLGDA